MRIQSVFHFFVTRRSCSSVGRANHAHFLTPHWLEREHWTVQSAEAISRTSDRRYTSSYCTHIQVRSITFCLRSVRLTMNPVFSGLKTVTFSTNQPPIIVVQKAARSSGTTTGRTEQIETLVGLKLASLSLSLHFNPYYFTPSSSPRLACLVGSNF